MPRYHSGWIRHVFHAAGAGQIDLGPIITHRLSLADAEKGIVFMKESRENKIKGVILFD